MKFKRSFGFALSTPSQILAFSHEWTTIKNLKEKSIHEIKKSQFGAIVGAEEQFKTSIKTQYETQ